MTNVMARKDACCHSTSALHFLFSHNYSAKPKPGEEILKSGKYFSRGKRHFSSGSLRRHRFADCRELGLARRGQRHELIGVHGYDIKAAMHVIRLLNEGIDLMRSGTITLPRPEKELLITIRTGQYGSLERVLTLANTLFSQTGAGRSHERTAGKSGQSPSLKTGWRYLFELLDRLIPPLHPRCPCRIAG